MVASPFYMCPTKKIQNLPSAYSCQYRNRNTVTIQLDIHAFIIKRTLSSRIKLQDIS